MKFNLKDLFDTDANLVSCSGLLDTLHWRLFWDILQFGYFSCYFSYCCHECYCQRWDSVATSVTFLKLLLSLVQGDTVAILPLDTENSFTVLLWGYCCH
jgi:hypothetical protein